MILFPFAKINIGLEVLRKRPDNYHDLETIFYPLNLCDILEINKSDTFHFSISGLNIDERAEENIVVKAYRIMQAEYKLPSVSIHLHKQIPSGAGLGGGSSDAAFTLLALNQIFELKLSREQLIGFALYLGSDCAFFLQKKPVLAEGRGEILSPVELKLSGFKLVVIKPDCSVSTASAYKNIRPNIQEDSLKELINQPVGLWEKTIFNYFEHTVFHLFPEIREIKEKLYKLGAVYSSMSGSGSAVYALFDKSLSSIKSDFPNCFYWEENL
jgi:4-diphosphocytidyl-2-C-methyl-D-erythritol kinase